MGVRRQTPEALSRAWRGGGAAARLARRGSWAVERTSLRWRLDKDTRSSSTARQDLPPALSGAEAERRTVIRTDQVRAAVLSRIRSALVVTERESQRKAAVEDRLAHHPRGTI